jgi:hypothetical protein
VSRSKSVEEVFYGANVVPSLVRKIGLVKGRGTPNNIFRKCDEN